MFGKVIKALAATAKATTTTATTAATTAAAYRSFARAARGSKINVNVGPTTTESLSTTPPTPTTTTSFDQITSLTNETALTTPSGGPTTPYTIMSDTGIARILSHPTVVIVRRLELLNIGLGVEQGHKYSIHSTDGEVLGYLVEDSNSWMTVIQRQVLRTHRPFKATVFGLDGQPLLKFERPFYFVKSSITVEDVVHNSIVGEVHQRWHLWKRQYELFVRKHQFGKVNGGFLAIDFPVLDKQGDMIARVDKNFTGFAREIFTDARQYAVHFHAPVDSDDDEQQLLQHQQQQQLSSQEPQQHHHHQQQQQNSLQTLQQQQQQQLKRQAVVTQRNLSFDERAAVLAMAVSIDFDHFSLHSTGPGIFMLLLAAE